MSRGRRRRRETRATRDAVRSAARTLAARSGGGARGRPPADVELRGPLRPDPDGTAWALLELDPGLSAQQVARVPDAAPPGWCPLLMAGARIGEPFVTVHAVRAAHDAPPRRRSTASLHPDPASARAGALDLLALRARSARAAGLAELTWREEPLAPDRVRVTVTATALLPPRHTPLRLFSTHLAASEVERMRSTGYRPRTAVLVEAVARRHLLAPAVGPDRTAARGTALLGTAAPGAEVPDVTQAWTGALDAVRAELGRTRAAEGAGMVLPGPLEFDLRTRPCGEDTDLRLAVRVVGTVVDGRPDVDAATAGPTVVLPLSALTPSSGPVSAPVSGPVPPSGSGRPR